MSNDSLNSLRRPSRVLLTHAHTSQLPLVPPLLSLAECDCILSLSNNFVETTIPGNVDFVKICSPLFLHSSNRIKRLEVSICSKWYQREIKFYQNDQRCEAEPTAPISTLRDSALLNILRIRWRKVWPLYAWGWSFERCSELEANLFLVYCIWKKEARQAR